MVVAAYGIVFVYCYPVKWICQTTLIGPGPGMENYTETLQNVPEWSDHSLAYTISIPVSGFKILEVLCCKIFSRI
jgi:hypothetical protein